DDHVFLCGKCKKQFNSLPGVLDSQKGAVPAGRPIARHCFAGLQQHLHTCTACRRCAATTGEQTGLDGQHGAAIAPYTHPGARQHSGERRGSRVCHLGVRGHEGFLS
ncbi:zinc finger MYM-type protein 4, partial [Clarias magur]